MKRVMIVGISGAGKSTLGRRLGDRFGLPVHHLDNIYHKAGWIARDEAEVERDFEAIAKEERWVVDGNYRRLSTALQERAEVVVFLDFGTLFAIRQVTQRWALHRLGWRKRRDLGEGFEEQLPWSFILWVWNWRRDNRPKWVEQMKMLGDKAHIFRTRREVQAWLEQL